MDEHILRWPDGGWEHITQLGWTLRAWLPDASGKRKVVRRKLVPMKLSESEALIVVRIETGAEAGLTF